MARLKLWASPPPDFSTHNRARVWIKTIPKWPSLSSSPPCIKSFASQDKGEIEHDYGIHHPINNSKWRLSGLIAGLWSKHQPTTMSQAPHMGRHSWIIKHELCGRRADGIFFHFNCVSCSNISGRFGRCDLRWIWMEYMLQLWAQSNPFKAKL